MLGKVYFEGGVPLVDSVEESAEENDGEYSEPRSDYSPVEGLVGGCLSHWLYDCLFLHC